MNKNKEITRKEVIKFVKKEYLKSGIAPSRRKIGRKFNISLDTYFENGMEGLFELCRFKFSPEENKQKAREKFYLKRCKYKRKEVVEYFIQQIKKGINPTRNAIQKRFSISLGSYFPKGIREVYQVTGFDFPIWLRDKKNLQKDIVQYIQSQVKKRIYPTHDEINEKFHTNIEGSVRRLYELAGVEYKREPNPFLCYLKEKRLSEIAQKPFLRLGYKIKKVSIGPSSRGGPDIILIRDKKLIPVELKAYQKFGKIGRDNNSKYYRDEINQLKKFIKDIGASYGYLVTSTDRKAFKRKPPFIRILFGRDIKELLEKFELKDELKNLDWIRNSSVSYGKTEAIEATQKKILNYVKRKTKKSRYVPRREVEKALNITLGSYFPDMKTIYERLNIDPYYLSHFRMGGHADKSRIKKEMIRYVKENTERGEFPTHKKIRKEFNCLLKSYFPGGVREIYRLARVNYQRKFASKTFEEKEFTRQKIIKYTVQKLRNGFYPGYRDIESKFHINFRYYFKCPEELYQKAGYTGHVKKTWKNSERTSA